jgi:ABC-type nitrate/sulfonate/bicarbonate transport system permease component
VTPRGTGSQPNVGQRFLGRAVRSLDPVAFLGVLLGFLALVGLWELASRQLGLLRLPGPELTLQTTKDNFFSSALIEGQGGGTGGIFAQLLVTTYRMVIGVAIGTVSGVAVGVLMATVEPIRQTLRPALEALRVTPSLVAAPFLILWFGVAPAAQYGLIAFYTFVTLQMYVFSAVVNLRPEILKFAYTLGASKRQVMRRVILPGIVPELVGGLRVVFQVGWGLVLVSELIGAQEGIGRMMSSGFAILRVDLVIAGILCVSIVAMLVDKILWLSLHWMTRWHEGLGQHV